MALASWKAAANRRQTRSHGIMSVWFSGANFGYMSNQELQAPSHKAEAGPGSGTRRHSESHGAVQRLLAHIEAVTCREAKGCLLRRLCFVPITKQLQWKMWLWCKSLQVVNVKHRAPLGRCMILQDWSPHPGVISKTVPISSLCTGLLGLMQRLHSGTS